MDDKTILDHINQLVEEEKALRAGNHAVNSDDRTRLRHLQEELDQAWDLLRQRRARVEYDENPDQVQERSVNEVEGYLQ
jgi:hypothetical protein